MTPTNSENQISERIEQLETRISQLETALKKTVAFKVLADRLVGNTNTKKVRKQRATQVLTPEQKSCIPCPYGGCKVG